MPVSHVVPTGLPTGVVAGKVAGDDWRAGHLTPPFTVSMGQVSGNTITNMPAALAVLGGVHTRVQVDLTNVAEARLSVGIFVAGAASAEIRVQYATDGAAQSTWDYLDAAGGPAANISATGLRTGAWVALAAGAKSDAILRLVTINGDGVLDPVYGLITVAFR